MDRFILQGKFVFIELIWLVNFKLDHVKKNESGQITGRFRLPSLINNMSKIKIIFVYIRYIRVIYLQNS